MVKKVLFTFLILPMIFSSVCYAKEEKKDSPGSAIFVMAIPKEIEITDELMQKHTKELSITMHVPQLEGLNNKKFERKVNKYFKERATALQKEVKLAREQTDSTKDSMRYEVISNYTLKESINNFLVLGFLDYLYVGGAHGLPTQSYVVIDTETNQILTLNQLFGENTDYKEQIVTLIHQQIEERRTKGQLFYDDLFHALTINENERFYIKPNGDLVIVFNVYEIAPYASGVVEFVLPKDSLKDYKLNR